MGRRVIVSGWGLTEAPILTMAFDENRYLRKGDLGDDDGYVVITGRLEEVIIRNDENVSAKEVEDLMYSHPKAQDVAVIGLPDPRTGERPCAKNVLREQSATSPSPDPEELPMADVTLYHNPKCSTSNHAMGVVKELGTDVEVVQYLKTPPDRTALERIVGILQDPVEDLVRKDANFEKLGLSPDDFAGNPQAVVDVLVDHPQLLQRPLLVKGDTAIIGRPKDRVAAFVGG